jgi:serine/threonine protein kinase/WD40 repeat protein
MKVRCPHCQNPIEIIEQEFEEIDCPSCGSSFNLVAFGDTVSHKSKAPKNIAHYSLVEQLGVGAFGTVWKAHDQTLDRTVALKLPRNGQLDGQDVDQFLREARAAAQLKHANIVGVHEVGHDDGSIYIASDYVEGANLKEWLSAKRLGPRDAAELCVKIAEALDHSHEQGVIHRDLKPANIMVDLDGEPHVMDFGLAKREAGEITMTIDGKILGTPVYMPPEQARGEGHNADRRSDVYSLGVVLYELLTGEAPFRGETRMLIVQILRDEPPSPRKLNSHVTRDLETICLKCLQKDPQRRYQTAAALAADLRRFLAGEPIEARPVSSVERAWRWCRRNPAVATSLSLLAASLLIGTAISMHFALRSARDATIADAAARDAQAARDDATEQLHGSYLAQARAVRWSGKSGRRFDSLTALGRAAAIQPTMKLRNEAIACLGLADLRLAERTWQCPNASAAFAVSTSLEKYAFADDEGNVTVFADGGSVIARIEGSGNPAFVMRFSPDARYLAVKHHPPNQHYPSQFSIWDCDNGNDEQAVKVLDVSNGIYHRSLSFGPNSRRVAVASRRELLIYDLPSSEPTNRIPLTVVPISLSFSPEGQRVAVCGSDSLLLYDLIENRLTSVLSHPSAVRHVAWHPSGERLASACSDFNVYLWDIATGSAQKPSATLIGHEGVVTRVAFNRAGNLLASTSWDNNLLIWDAMDGDLLIREPSASVGRNLAFTEDDAHLIGWRQEKQAGLWEVNPGSEHRRFPAAKRDRVWHAEINPEGNLLAVARDTGVRIWHISSLREVARLPIGHTRGSFFWTDGTNRSLITWGIAGLQLWPMKHASSDSASHIDMGPPEQLVGPVRYPEYAALSDNGRMIAMGDKSQGQIAVYDLKRKEKTISVDFGNPSAVAISPDGSFVAAGTWAAPKNIVRVWTEEGKQVFQRDVPNGSRIAFSPDGQWFVVMTGASYQSYRLESFEPGPTIPRSSGAGRIVFSRRSGLLAVNPTGTALKLFDAAKQTELATLPTGRPLSLSDDGGQLVVLGQDQRVDVWDLREIRGQLKAMQLDWDMPAYRPQPAQPDTLPRLVVTLAEPTRAIQPKPDRGVVGVLSRPDREATNEQINTWIEQLLGESGKNKADALNALLEVGAKALPIIDKTAADASEEGKSALLRLAVRIEAEQAIRPTLVTAKYDGVPLTDAINDLASKTPMTIAFGRYSGETGLDPKLRKITLELQDVPFWQALDRLCDAGGLRHKWSAGDLRHASDRGDEKTGALAYAGNCRLEMMAITYRRMEKLDPTAPGADEGFTMFMRANAESGSAVLGFFSPWLTSATDEKGRSLLPDRVTRFRYPLNSRPETESLTGVATLEAGVYQGGDIGNLEGILPVQVAVRRQTLAEVQNLLDSEGASIKGPEGMTFSLQEVSLRGALLSVTYQAKGLGSITSPKDFTLEAFDAEGHRVTIHQDTTTFDRTGSITSKVRFFKRINGGLPARLVFSRHQRAWVELPFEFRNVKLP